MRYSTSNIIDCCSNSESPQISGNVTSITVEINSDNCDETTETETEWEYGNDFGDCHFLNFCEDYDNEIECNLRRISDTINYPCIWKIDLFSGNEWKCMNILPKILWGIYYVNPTGNDENSGNSYEEGIFYLIFFFFFYFILFYFILFYFILFYFILFYYYFFFFC
jgi:hypothetical protein